MVSVRKLDGKLDLMVREFAQRELKHTIFLNAVPKSGIHLLRNIVRMFVPIEQHYHHELVQLAFLKQHGRALGPEKRFLACGHLIFADVTVKAVGDARHVVLVRDPYDLVLAQARFYLSAEVPHPGLAHLKTGETPVPALLNLMILGVYQKLPALREIYLHNCIAWRGTGAVFVKYEDIVAAAADLDSGDAEAFFRRLLAHCGIDPVPRDWRERVRIGADPKFSRTARGRLTLPPGMTVPDVLPDAQKELLDYAAPGLRKMLGYA
jgi:hypothetical protein